MSSFATDSGPFNGIPAPFPVAGVNAYFPPHWAVADSALNITTTINRLYYIPYYFTNIVSYTGLACRNAGVGDNGEVFRVGVYQASASTGLPSTLVSDVGQGTLTGAAADRLVAGSFTAPYVGWGYLAFHANTAAVWRGASAIDSGSTRVGVIDTSPQATLFGTSAIPEYGNVSLFAAYYVDTAYGALASTAVSPTAIATLAPYLMPYRT
jgi:hypothetical protein